MDVAVTLGQSRDLLPRVDMPLARRADPREPSLEGLAYRLHLVHDLVAASVLGAGALVHQQIRYVAALQADTASAGGSPMTGIRPSSQRRRIPAIARASHTDRNAVSSCQCSTSSSSIWPTR